MPRAPTSEVAAKLVSRSIRGARTEVGITQAELAARMNLNASYVTNVEAGRVNLTVGQFVNIAEPVLDREPICLMPG
jgi:transcriptional regulator with XRE-family HTH domain